MHYSPAKAGDFYWRRRPSEVALATQGSDDRWTPLLGPGIVRDDFGACFGYL